MPKAANIIPFQAQSKERTSYSLEAVRGMAETVGGGYSQLTLESRICENLLTCSMLVELDVFCQVSCQLPQRTDFLLSPAEEAWHQDQREAGDRMDLQA